MNELSNNQFSIHALSSVKLIVELDRVIKHEKNENYYKYKPNKILTIDAWQCWRRNLRMSLLLTSFSGDKC